MTLLILDPHGNSAIDSIGVRFVFPRVEIVLSFKTDVCRRLLSYYLISVIGVAIAYYPEINAIVYSPRMSMFFFLFLSSRDVNCSSTFIEPIPISDAFGLILCRGYIVNACRSLSQHLNGP